MKRAQIGWNVRSFKFGTNTLHNSVACYLKLWVNRHILSVTYIRKTLRSTVVSVCNFINHLRVTRKWTRQYWFSFATVTTRARQDVTLYVRGLTSCKIMQNYDIIEPFKVPQLLYAPQDSTLRNSTFCPQTAFVYFIWFTTMRWWSILRTKNKCVYKYVYLL